MAATWKDWPEGCPECGCGLQALTTHAEEGWATDGDPVRCTYCGATGSIDVDAETPARVRMGAD